MRVLTIVAAVLFSAISALAADVSGTWAMNVDAPDGAVEATLTLKQDGDKITGTVSSQMGDAPVTGTLKDNDITFTMVMDAGGQNVTIVYTARVAADKMEGSLDFGGQGEIKFTATKKS
jgi:hypothetical protein